MALHGLLQGKLYLLMSFATSKDFSRGHSHIAIFINTLPFLLMERRIIALITLYQIRDIIKYGSPIF
jgi:hypothetical protein